MRAVLIFLVSFLLTTHNAIAQDRTVVTFVMGQDFEIDLTARFTYHTGNLNPTEVPLAFDHAVPTYELQIKSEPLVHCDVYLERSATGSIEDVSFDDSGYPTEVYKDGKLHKLERLETELTAEGGPCPR